MYSNNPNNHIEILDLTGNNLAEDPDRFVDLLKSEIFPFKEIDELILVDNGFDSSIVSLIKGSINCSIGTIHI